VPPWRLRPASAWAAKVVINYRRAASPRTGCRYNGGIEKTHESLPCEHPLLSVCRSSCCAAGPLKEAATRRSSPTRAAQGRHPQALRRRIRRPDAGQGRIPSHLRDGQRQPRGRPQRTPRAQGHAEARVCNRQIRSHAGAVSRGHGRQPGQVEGAAQLRRDDHLDRSGRFLLPRDRGIAISQADRR